MQKPRRSNRLIDESSPYLLQHAHNPVDWYPWGPEALARAKAEDKPVLLSVGYSACHWCHVMEHESFENDEIAALMNENFVSIKVDREERPDIDQIYMNFVQLTTGRGGWPMTVFLTPEGLPFFGGTYFPPYDRYNMPGFPRILQSVAEAYRDKRDEILSSTTEMLVELRRIGLVEADAAALSAEQLERAYKSIIRGYDAANGGFGGAPKFPAPMSLEFLLREFDRTKDPQALDIVTHTCRKMADGGMYDHLGGGFARYSVDALWLVPHFEKMLYDNAQLAKLYLHVWQITKDEYFKQKCEEILDYVLREMTDELGGFYSAQDADSEGEEGKFFVWTPAELKEILGGEEARLFGFHFDVSESGNFEHGTSILHERQPVEGSAKALGVSVEKLNEIIAQGKEKLFAVREKRIKPMRDEKVLTAWNGLMLSAFAEAGFVLGREDYLAAARKNAAFILTNMRAGEGYLLRTYGNGKAKLNAYLEDYALFIEGLLALFEATGETSLLKEAARLADLMIAEFWDEEQGGFFFTGKNHEELIVRSRDLFDSATPAGNSVAAEVLVKLEKLTGDDKYSRYAAGIFRLLSGQLLKYPQAFARALTALSFYLAAVKEIVILYDTGQSSNGLIDVLRENYIPNKIVVTSEIHGDAELLPILEGKELIGDSPTAFVCENYTCQEPVTETDRLVKQLLG
jgi:uncharacterized protein YyaL (SSP411 family)